MIVGEASASSIRINLLRPAPLNQLLQIDAAPWLWRGVGASGARPTLATGEAGVSPGQLGQDPCEDPLVRGAGALEV